jgi:hypothetical protein
MKHQEIIESLPWYVNGTLSQPERAEIAQHLATGCRECAQEVASLTTLRKAVVAVGDDTPEPSPYLLNRALAQIEDYERTRVQEENRKKEKSGSSFRWLSTMSAIWGRQTPAFARMALAAQMAVLLAVGVVAIYQYTHPRVVEVPYVTLGHPIGQGTGATIGVIFNENVSEREIRQTLDGIGGTIIAGPSAQNMYTIELKNVPQGNMTEIERTLDKLRQNKRVISLAQLAQ